MTRRTYGVPNARGVVPRDLAPGVLRVAAAERLRRVCADWPPAQFARLVDDVVRFRLRWAHDAPVDMRGGNERHVNIAFDGGSLGTYAHGTTSASWGTSCSTLQLRETLCMLTYPDRSSADFLGRATLGLAADARRATFGAVPRGRHFPRRRSVALAAGVGTLTLVACGRPPVPAQRPTPPPAADAPADTAVYKRFSVAEFEARVLGPRALLRDVAISGLGQVAKRPKEWSKTWNGYGDRLSSRLGTEAISQAVTLGVSAALDERPADFTRCGCVGTGPRLRHAALTPWLMQSPTGTHVSLIAPASEVGSSILITSVHPRGFSVRDGLRSGAFSVLGTSAFAALREFWPWHRRPFGL